MNIQETYGRKTVVGYKSKHGETADVPLPEWLVGIELEIEGFDPEHTREWGGITFTEDGSLRENEDGVGIEAITKPIAIKHVEPFLRAFFKHFGIKENNYSERCSTHVHFNVEPLTFEQVGTICLVYQTVENLLFHYVGNERENNIFCVPWGQSNVTYNIVSRIEGGDANDVFRRWQKYSALNLMPIIGQGTIEFRHLHGTCDVSLIGHWIYLIAKIFEYAQKVTIQEAQDSIMNMNTVSNYHEWTSMIFGKYAVLLQTPQYERELFRGVIDSKVMLMGKGGNKAKKLIFDQYVNMFDGPAINRENVRINPYLRVQDDIVEPPPPAPVPEPRQSAREAGILAAEQRVFEWLRQQADQRSRAAATQLNNAVARNPFVQGDNELPHAYFYNAPIQGT